MAGFAERCSPSENRLLDSLPTIDCQRLGPHLQPIRFSAGQVVCEAGELLDHVYFPTTAVICSLYTTQEGAVAETGMTGSDGVFGITVVLGGDTTPSRSVVQIAGGAFRLPANIFREEFARGGSFQQLLLRHIQALLTQVSQTAVCNRLHTIEKRLCRWLLSSHDHTKSKELRMTQEFISNMLGRRRESVTLAAGHLQDAGLIHYSRGHIVILDREGLEAATCECYHVVKRETDRLLGKTALPIRRYDPEQKVQVRHRSA